MRAPPATPWRTSTPPRQVRGLVPVGQGGDRLPRRLGGHARQWRPDRRPRGVARGDPGVPREADAHAWTPAVLGCSEKAGTVWVRETGFAALELGDEAVVDATAFTLEGRPMRNVRQMVSRIERAGLCRRGQPRPRRRRGRAQAGAGRRGRVASARTPSAGSPWRSAACSTRATPIACSWRHGRMGSCAHSSSSSPGVRTACPWTSCAATARPTRGSTSCSSWRPCAQRPAWGSSGSR